MHLVHQYNEQCGQLKVAYTYDAGPNAVLYLLDDETLDFMRFLVPHLRGSKSRSESSSSTPLQPLQQPPPSSLEEFIREMGVAGDSPFADVLRQCECGDDGAPLDTTTTTTSNTIAAGSIRRMIYTRVGEGPRVVDRRQW